MLMRLILQLVLLLTLSCVLCLSAQLSFEHSFVIQPDGQETVVERPYRFQIETRDEFDQPYSGNISWDFSKLLSSPAAPSVSRDRITVSRPSEPWLWEFVVRFAKVGDGIYAPYYTLNPAVNGTSICPVAAVIVYPATPGNASIAVGQGLIAGIAGLPNNFTIQVVDASGRQVYDGGSSVQVAINPTALSVSLDDNRNGSYAVTWTGGLATIYDITILTGDVVLLQYPVPIAPGDISPLRTCLLSPRAVAGTTSSCYTGSFEFTTPSQISAIRIQAFDQFGNALNRSGDALRFSTALDSVQGQKQPDPVIADLGLVSDPGIQQPGLYSISFTRIQKDWHYLEVLLDGKHIVGSPFEIDASSLTASVDCSSTQLTVPEQGSAFDTATLTLRIFDTLGNPYTSLIFPANFLRAFSYPDLTEVTQQLDYTTELQSDKYVVRFLISLYGTLELRVLACPPFQYTFRIPYTGLPCSSSCNGNGACIGGFCKCKDGFNGESCIVAPTPQPIDARIQDDLCSFAVRFDSDTNLANLTGLFNCSQLLRGTALYGSGALCYWRDSRTLVGSLGAFVGSQENMTGVGTRFTLRGGLLRSKTGDSVAMRAINVTLQPPLAPVSPVLVIDVPSDIFVHETLVLDATSSTGAGLVPLTFRWAFLLSPTTDAAVANSWPATFNVSRVEIPAWTLSPGLYSFQLTAQNSYAQAASVLFNVTVRLPQLPQRVTRLHIEGVRNVSLTKATPIYLRREMVSALVCEKDGSTNSTGLYAIGDDSCLPAINASLFDANLFAGAESILWIDAVPRTYGDKDFLFLPATGSASGAPAALFPAQQLVVRADIGASDAIAFQNGPFTERLAFRSDFHSAPSLDWISLDCGDSFTATAAINTTQFLWECAIVDANLIDTSPNCFDPEGAAVFLKPTSGPVLRLPPTVLPAGNYRFSCRTESGASASTFLTVFGGLSPPRSCDVHLYAMNPLGRSFLGQRRVRARDVLEEDTLFLQAYLLPALKIPGDALDENDEVSANATDYATAAAEVEAQLRNASSKLTSPKDMDVSYQWSVTPPLPPSAFISSLDSSTLLIRPRSLVRGSEYLFVLNASSSTGNSSSYVTVTCRSPPLIGYADFAVRLTGGPANVRGLYTYNLAFSGLNAAPDAHPLRYVWSYSTTTGAFGTAFRELFPVVNLTTTLEPGTTVAETTAPARNISNEDGSPSTAVPNGPALQWDVVAALPKGRSLLHVAPLLSSMAEVLLPSSARVLHLQCVDVYGAVVAVSIALNSTGEDLSTEEIAAIIAYVKQNVAANASTSTDRRLQLLNAAFASLVNPLPTLSNDELIDRSNLLETLLTFVSDFSSLVLLPHNPTALDVYVQWAVRSAAYIWYAPVRVAVVNVLRLHVFPRMLQNGTAPEKVKELMDLLSQFLPYFPRTYDAFTVPRQALFLSSEWLLLVDMLCEVLAQTMTPQQTPLLLGADSEPNLSNLSIGVHLYNDWAMPEVVTIDSNQTVRIGNLSAAAVWHPIRLRPLRSAVIGIQARCTGNDEYTLGCNQFVNDRVPSRVNISMIMFALRAVQRLPAEEVACVQWDALAGVWTTEGCFRVPGSVEPVDEDPLQFRAVCSCDRLNTYYAAMLSAALFGAENRLIVPQTPLEGAYWRNQSLIRPENGIVRNVQWRLFAVAGAVLGLLLVLVLNTACCPAPPSARSTRVRIAALWQHWHSSIADAAKPQLLDEQPVITDGDAARAVGDSLVLSE